jgi:hypothetical protein
VHSATLAIHLSLTVPTIPAISTRQGSHRWAIHDTVTAKHEVNAAFTRPRYKKGSKIGAGPKIGLREGFGWCSVRYSLD